MKASRQNYCVNCGKPLRLDGQCGVCGHHHFAPIDSSKCAFSYGNHQCPALGMISQSITGGDRFYCAAHYRARDDREKSIDILNNYIKNGIPARRDWRDELLEAYIRTGQRHDAA